MLHEMLGDTPAEEALGNFEEKKKRKQKSRGHFAPLERGLMPSLPTDGGRKFKKYCGG